MNAKTRLTPEGSIPIPEDVRARMNLTPGMTFEIDEPHGVIHLKPRIGVFQPDKPRTTIEDIRAFPKWEGPAKSVEEISGLDDETLRQIFDERDRESPGH